jgi:ATP-dependent DNA ligase
MPEERKAKLVALLKNPPPATGRGLDPGLTVAEMKRCIWVRPSMVCEVKFTEWTRDDRLRQPVFLGSQGGQKRERKLSGTRRADVCFENCGADLRRSSLDGT